MTDSPSSMTTFRLIKERETKNTVLYVNPDDDSALRNVYLSKALVQSLGDPAAITLAISESS